MSAPASHGQAPTWVRNVLDRAAMLLRFHGPGAIVSVPWWADGKEARYLARMGWPDGTDGDRVIVVTERSGEFLCKSLPGQPFDIDPGPDGWHLSVDEDELDRFQWEQARRSTRKGRT